jgi:hypothetical protein
MGVIYLMSFLMGDRKGRDPTSIGKKPSQEPLHFTALL